MLGCFMLRILGGYKRFGFVHLGLPTDEAIGFSYWFVCVCDLFCFADLINFLIWYLVCGCVSVCLLFMFTCLRLWLLLKLVAS